MSARTNRNEDRPDDLIGTKEAASLVPSSRPGRGTHISTILRWVLSGKLRGWKMGGRLFVSRADVLAMPKPVEVELQPDVLSDLERRKRDQETDEVLRRAGIRR